MHLFRTQNTELGHTPYQTNKHRIRTCTFSDHKTQNWDMHFIRPQTSSQLKKQTHNNMHSKWKHFFKHAIYSCCQLLWLYSTRDRISKKYWENDTDREKLKYMEQNLSQCHAVNHKSHVRMVWDWTQANVHLVEIQWIANVNTQVRGKQWNLHTMILVQLPT